MPGAFFVCESAPVNSDSWRTFLTFHFDDPIEVPKDRFHLVNEKVAYAYSNDNVFVTNDSGTTWQSGNTRALGGVKNVRIEADGNGRLQVEGCFKLKEPCGVTTLTTSDFGKTWIRED